MGLPSTLHLQIEGADVMGQKRSRASDEVTGKLLEFSETNLIKQELAGGVEEKT